MNKIVVHGGVFHTDDVVCVAMLKLLKPDIVVERNNNPVPATNTVIADVGGGRYDHHDDSMKRHHDGSKYAACGLLYEDLKAALVKGATPSGRGCTFRVHT